MQRATFLDSLITARRASSIPTPRSTTGGPVSSAATPLPPRLAVAHLTTPGNLTSRTFRAGTPKAGAGPLPSSRMANSGSMTARTPPAATPTGAGPAALSVAALAELAAKRRAAAAKALELQAAAAALRSAAAARRADLADMGALRRERGHCVMECGSHLDEMYGQAMLAASRWGVGTCVAAIQRATTPFAEVANTALAAEVMSLRGQVDGEASGVSAARKALMETMKAS